MVVVIVVIAGAVLLLGAGGIGWYFTRKQPTPEPTFAPAVQSHRSYTIRSDASRLFQPNTLSIYSFSVVDDQGTTLRDFATVHEKLTHVIIVRKDLAEFQHVHPTFDEQTGAFALSDLTFPSDGPYRIFADFTPAEGQKGPDGQPLGVTIYDDVLVGDQGKYAAQPLAGDAHRKTVDGYDVQLATTPPSLAAQTLVVLSFTLSRGGTPVRTLEPYLGALGHTVVLREGDLEFLHTHALDEQVANQTGTVDFAVTFPREGQYKVFSQFQHEGKILTTDFVVSVAKAAEMPTGDMPMEHQRMGH